MQAADLARREQVTRTCGYLAEALALRFPGFADVEYRDWRGLLGRLATEARAVSVHHRRAGELVDQRAPGERRVEVAWRERRAAPRPGAGFRGR